MSSIFIGPGQPAPIASGPGIGTTLEEIEANANKRKAAKVQEERKKKLARELAAQRRALAEEQSKTAGVRRRNAQQQRKEAFASQGQNSRGTVLTGPGGVLGEPNLRRRTLLGG